MEKLTLLVYIVFYSEAFFNRGVEADCPPGHVPFRNHCYFPSFKDGNPIGTKDWSEAREYCRSLSTQYPAFTYDLISLQSKEEYDFILNNRWSDEYEKNKRITHIWTGLNDINKQRDYTWSDGSPLEYANPKTAPNSPPWRTGEPHDTGDFGGIRENCVNTYGFEGLQDENCDQEKSFICEGTKNSVCSHCFIPYVRVQNGVCHSWSESKAKCVVTNDRNNDKYCSNEKSFYQGPCLARGPQYYIRKYNTRCSPQQTIATLSECKHAVRELGLTFSKEGNWPTYPKGCYGYVKADGRGSYAYYNTHASGRKNSYSLPICTKTVATN